MESKFNIKKTKKGYNLTQNVNNVFGKKKYDLGTFSTKKQALNERTLAKELVR